MFLKQDFQSRTQNSSLTFLRNKTKTNTDVIIQNSFQFMMHNVCEILEVVMGYSCNHGLSENIYRIVDFLGL